MTGGFDGVASRPVQYRWWTVDPWPALRHRGVLILWWLLRLARAAIRRRSTRQLSHPAGRHVAIYPADAEAGAPALLVFEVGADTFGASEGAGEGVLFGELGPNGVLTLATEHGLVWPTYNPRAPYPGSPPL